MATSLKSVDGRSATLKDGANMELPFSVCEASLRIEEYARERNALAR